MLLVYFSAFSFVVLIFSSKSQDLQLSFRSFIASYFEKFSTKKRQIVELPWQLVKTKNFQKLKTFLTEPRFELKHFFTTKHNIVLYRFPMF